MHSVSLILKTLSNAQSFPRLGTEGLARVLQMLDCTGVYVSLRKTLLLHQRRQRRLIFCTMLAFRLLSLRQLHEAFGFWERAVFLWCWRCALEASGLGSGYR